MKGILYLAGRYLAYHRLKASILITAITLILYVPVGLRVLVNQSATQLTARAVATPLVIGARGSPLELVLNTLYFATDVPAPMRYAQLARVADSGLASAIPLHTGFDAQGHPIVGTSIDYFEFRGLTIAAGRQMGVLGESVLGSRVARALGVAPGGFVVSSPESVFDLAGAYPLRMRVVGVLAPSESPDDDAVFVDIKTAWVIAGLGHGHEELASPEAQEGVLSRDGNRIVANASVMEYNEITPDNIDTFHFHGDLSEFPLSAVIAVPPDERNAALLRGRYQADDETAQILLPAEVMDELLGTILTVQQFVVAGAVILGLATLASAALVFLLSLRLRRRERDTLFKIGGSRGAVAMVMASEIVVVLAIAVLLAGGLTLATREFGALLVRALVSL
jgi:putative ABC transport system permease protein